MWHVSGMGGRAGPYSLPLGVAPHRRPQPAARSPAGDGPLASPSSLPLFLPACGLGSGGAGGTATLPSQPLGS